MYGEVHGPRFAHWTLPLTWETILGMDISAASQSQMETPGQTEQNSSKLSDPRNYPISFLLEKAE